MVMQSDDLIIEAKKHIGEYKLYTGEDDTLPWCARFIVSCMRDIGMNPPDTWSAKGLYDWCTPVPDDEVREGDLVVFNLDGRLDTSWFDHIGIVLWFDHASDTYKTIEGNSGSEYSVGTYFYDNSDYPPMTYFCRPPYDDMEIGEDSDMITEDDFDAIWCDHSFNHPPIDGKWSATPGNILLHMLGQLDTVSKYDIETDLETVLKRVDDIESRLDMLLQKLG